MNNVATPPVAAPAKDYTGVLTAGWICAFILPLVGLIIGAILLGKDEKGGIGVMITSAVMFVVWIVIFATAA